MDSRRKRIQAGMESPGIICRCFSGATLLLIRPHVEVLIKKIKPITCMILVGVNDLTILDRPSRTVTLTKYDAFDLANMVIARILSLRRYLISCFPYTKIIFGGINGLDIAPKIQNIVDDCITQINAYLRLLNRVGGHYHPRFTSKVHIWRSARRINCYHLLRDGLHFGGVVIQSWITSIFRTHYINTLGLPC